MSLKTLSLGPTGAGSHDADLLGFIDQWAQGDATPDDVAPLPALANDAAPSATAAPVRAKKWTPEKVAELAEYRKAHGTKKAAAFAGVSVGRVRQLVPDRPPEGYSVFKRDLEKAR